MNDRSNFSTYLKLACAAITLSFTCASGATAATHKIKMQSISYDPKKIEAKIGDKIEWQNVAHTEHSATSDENGVFDTGMVQPNAKSKLITLEKAGSYSYHCSVHGKTMHGQIEVTK